MVRTLHALALALLLAACSSDARESPTFRASESETSDTETGEDEPETDFIATCIDALVHRTPVTLRGSLRPFVDDVVFDVPPIGRDCALTEDSPLGFVRVDIPIRADLRIHARGAQVVPHVAILQAGCASEALDRDRLLACVDTLPEVVEDLRAGTELLLAVGAAPDDPALATPEPAPGEFDPLEVEIQLSLRAVFDEGQLCDPGLGRCETGTHCLPVLDGEGEDAIEVTRCGRVDADSCANPGELSLATVGIPMQIGIDNAIPYGDSHAHACTGWRRPEQVHRLLLPTEISPTARLEIVADDPRVGLALRMPDCLPEHAHACVPADLDDGPHTLLVGEGQLAAWAEQGISPLLFIELPGPGGNPQIGVTLTIVEP